MTDNRTLEEMRTIVRDSGLRHIAFIMDGNGRWATSRGLSREAGHKEGAEAFRRVVNHCLRLDIQAVTAYVFSTENWKRPAYEIKAIMKLLDVYLDEASSEDEINKTRYIFLGDKSGLPDQLRKKEIALEEKTKHRQKILNLALNYGGRAEIVDTVNRLIAEGKRHLTEADINAALYTAESGDPDLIIRTASEYRLSNFLLWQAAYSELWFTDVCWPDMDERIVNDAILNFSGRKRRYGGLSDGN